MLKSKLKQPLLIYLYGIPGSGKSLLSHNISQELGMAVISADRIRFELFEEPRHDKAENQIIAQLMEYMAEEFLKAGVSVVYDASVNRFADRKTLRELAKKMHAKDLMIWLQVDVETAWNRTRNRDGRKLEDKYASELHVEQFKAYIKSMQNPNNEPYIVLSGKHQFANHKNILIRRLMEMGVVDTDSLQHTFAKPELINLVSRAQAQAGRVDYTRRNISVQ